MFKYPDNIVLEGKLSDNQHYNLTSLNFSSKSNFNELKKIFINKEIEFDNVSTKEKKENNENIVSINFVITNLINILNKKDTTFNCSIEKNYKYKTIQKKNIDKNFKLKKYKKINLEKENNTEKNEKYKKFIVHPIFKKATEVKNQLNEFKQINIFNNFKDKYSFRKDRYLDIKSNRNIVSNNKILTSFRNYKNNKPNLFFLKNVNKISNIATYGKNTIKDSKYKKYFKFDTNALEFLNSKKNDKWKKAINHQILLFISNKENKAEIFFKPEYFGSVNIKIKMKNDQATLNFVSSHNEIKVFLKNCVPFLRHALIKNGIQLEKINIDNSSFSKKNIYKKIAKNSLFDEHKLKKTSDFKEYCIKLIQCKLIDIYV
ncbi:flagellar hook-length control protein FliK [uncultured Buchnera sp.]|uniref:flagellar hook-length control protein FliK n=1 Tax=uncultured Buchnera sp. TaxID=574037 RepID=UPI0025E53F86|nr:flagellar hook-length control protein FliK [uncultured Buchnera sp.]